MTNGLLYAHVEKQATNGATARELPIAIIGAGPVGLAAAAHLIERSMSFVVFEAGPRVGHSALAWGHVQMFSPWKYTVDPAAVRLLEQTGWHAPDPEGYPTGRTLVEQYLAPLAAHEAIAPHVLLNRRVAHITRAGFDKMKTTGREQAPFQLSISGADGLEEIVYARAVIDASGTYTTPNPLGASGLPAAGERALSDRIVYSIPDVLGRERSRYAGKRVLVAGSGHSAFNAILDLAALAEQEEGTSVTWVVRRGEMGQTYGGGENDALPARGALGQRIRALVERGVVQLITGWRTDHLERTPDGIVVFAGDQALAPVDEIIVATGLRPDLAMLSELRLGLDPTVEAPTTLAPLIDPNIHSCGTVPPHGADELAHPEPNFYMIGMKSYGRAPTFLLLTGYEQARSVVAALAGDWEAARRVELVLPETGVCSGPVAAGGGTASSCCGPTLAAPVGGTNLIALTPVGAGVAVSALNIDLVVADSRAGDVAATGCCGGPAPAGTDACCVKDADAKAAGQDGCGCGATAVTSPEPVVAAGACCG
ncbi:MAG TPA: NAD(P)-binding domain-containing protein [Roseiflexaceae bacterium]|nr:NAD(P)-binding domain-containing protein [Roseiflexaceae bacterium]